MSYFKSSNIQYTQRCYKYVFFNPCCKNTTLVNKNIVADVNVRRQEKALNLQRKYNDCINGDVGRKHCHS